ncbi:substrate-binding family protein [Fontibacillus phaseoli]|uniref:Substrate-binding family protein n=1 Tax=Fontibacillus phaseoli TaxID=1416533 RepID=A0A369BMA6_9BACL|nr:substrate-binding domain-containing protein [Fontibacillus phaseoli]RCX22739.1 substrate-binding family protein [Fontibacillus phaseoli]
MPDQVSVTGFDNIEDTFLSEPRLTTVNVEKELMGKREVQVLFNHMNRPEFPKETIYMSALIVHRESIDPPPESR